MIKYRDIRPKLSVVFEVSSFPFSFFSILFLIIHLHFLHIFCVTALFLMLYSKALRGKFTRGWSKLNHLRMLDV